MIAIVDYGLGNIRAFANVYKRLNISCCIVKTSEELYQADKIILPGVGSFDYAMSLLNSSGMREMLSTLALEKGVPVLGVCVGMQILADKSDEGASKGLGWITGKVKKIHNRDKQKCCNYPLPHMGWNNIEIAHQDSILRGISSGARFYFLHSYYFECQDNNRSLATVEYGHEFSCMVKSANIYGVQFHPEKSHENGILLLKNFALG